MLTKCPTGKTCFATAEEAQQFFEQGKAKYGWQDQFPYVCPECSSYHLTSTPTEAHGLVRTNYDNLGMYAVKTEKVNSVEEAKRLALDGKKPGEIATTLGLAVSTVYQYAGKELKQAQETRSLGPSESVASVSPAEPRRRFRQLTVESLEEKEAALQQQILELQRKKQALIDAKKLKVALVRTAEGLAFDVLQDGNHIVLSMDFREELIEKLSNLADAVLPEEDAA